MTESSEYGESILFALVEDGKVLCETRDWGGTVRLWNPYSCRELFRISGLHGRLSADGRRLVCQRGSMFQLWHVAHGEGFRALPTQTAAANIPISYLNPADIRPDGRWLAVPGRREGIGETTSG